MGAVRMVFWMGILGLVLSPWGYAGGTEGADPFQSARLRMVNEQIADRGIQDPNVLAAMKRVPRHWFVPKHLRKKAYADHPLPIGEGQTISQPYIVALMTQALELSSNSRVLEVGTGSGYQAAVLAEVAGEVFTIEIKKGLYERSTQLLNQLGYGRVKTLFGDGYDGWEAAAPFDGIIVTAAVDHIPPPLLKQLKVGGRLILPLGNPFGYQNLVLITKAEAGYSLRQITGVLFVPMTGRAMEKKR